MFSASKTLAKRSLTSKLEVERKFVPTPLLKKHASETSNVAIISLEPTTNNSSHLLLTRLPRKRVLDKCFDCRGQLEQKGIWIRRRKEQTTKHDGTDAGPSEGF